MSIFFFCFFYFYGEEAADHSSHKSKRRIFGVAGLKIVGEIFFFQLTLQTSFEWEAQCFHAYTHEMIFLFTLKGHQCVVVPWCSYSPLVL